MDSVHLVDDGLDAVDMFGKGDHIPAALLWCSRRDDREEQGIGAQQDNHVSVGCQLPLPADLSCRTSPHKNRKPAVAKQAFSGIYYFQQQSRSCFPVPYKEARCHSHHRISNNRIDNAIIRMLLIVPDNLKFTIDKCCGLMYNNIV